MTGELSGDQLEKAPSGVEAGTGTDRCVVAIQGELDAFAVPEARAAIDGADGSLVELDLTGVTFIDSSGLAMIVEARQALMAQGRRLVLGPRSPIVQRLLELSGVAGRLDGDPSA